MLENDSMPAILPTATTPSPRADGVIQLEAMQTLLIEGNIVDGDYLDHIDVSITREGIPVWNQTWTPSNTWLFDLTQLTLPTLENAGLYQLKIVATDKLNWSSEVYATLEIK
jgi:hypothetical protein